MGRKEILDQVKEAYGFVPGFFAAAPDAALDHWWSELQWLQSDTALSAREKILVSFGAASAAHCEY